MSRRALLHLKKIDPILAEVIAEVGPCRFTPRTDGTHFDAVARAIVFQQLSGRAASTILGRVHGVFGGRAPTPTELLAVADEPLRAAGLSRQKIGYVRDLAARVSSGEVAMERLHELGDEEVIEALVRVKGVGVWTAQMFLIFRLGRMDVLPVADLGIKKGIQRAFRLPELPSQSEVARIGERWSPYATIASWYLWRSLDGAFGAA